MARYRRIDVRMWSDERFRVLSAPPPCGQVLWIYLLTNPDTSVIPGLYRASEGGLADALGWSVKSFRESFGEVFRQGLAKADWRARILWIPKAIRYNTPTNPNMVMSWRVPWDELPECPLKVEAYQHLKLFLEGLGKGFPESFAKACPNHWGNPLANREQEQEPETEREPEQEQERRSPEKDRTVSRAVKTRCPIPIPEGFTLLWEAYPRKTHRSAAVKAWLQLAPDTATVTAILAALEWQRRLPEWLDGRGRFVPHLATYLRGRRWEDERPAAASPISAKTAGNVEAVHSWLRKQGHP